MKLPKRFLAYVLACITVISLMEFLPAKASNTSTINNIQQQINQNQSELNKVNNQLSRYEAEREEALTYLDDQKSEMMNLMTEIAYYEVAIGEKEQSIANATLELEESMTLRDEQYEAMMVRIRYMYEQGGEENYLLMLLTSQSYADLLNRADYIDSIYSYDSEMLANYEKLVSDITIMRNTLETDKANLEAEKSILDAHEAELERIMADLKEKIADYDKLVADATAKAKEYKKKITSGQNQIAAIKKAEEEALKQQNQNNNNNNNNSNQVVGSGTGADVAKFACKYVGNPYVWGGTSLTNGADCSGFIMAVYAQFGYSLPHSSYSMRSKGTEVSLADAQAGDIICYSGHVALYIGDGKIVHAKNSQYGIVIDPVYYGWGGTGPTVLTVRRIIQ